MPDPGVRVEDLTADNVEDVLDVIAAPGQDRWVRPVAWYVARSAYEKVWTPVAFVVAGEVVGFAEWAYDPTDRTYCIGGFVIDRRHQRKGFGRAAMSALVAYLRQRPDCRDIALTVHGDNLVARRLYGGLGFAETDDRVDDELVMVLPANA